jgi:hypothetical protein
MHLPRLIEAIHEVRSPLVEPYVDCNRRQICATCAFLHSSICPCPMDYLAVLLVSAVEAVDQRHQQCSGAPQGVSGLPQTCAADMEPIARAYEEARGTWSVCDWPTCFGRAGLDLNGWTHSRAEAWAVETAGLAAEDWAAAAQWLRGVEGLAGRAETQAALALRAANAGQWREARQHAHQAWALEFATGRPIWRGEPPAWDKLWQAVEAAFLAHAHASSGAPTATAVGKAFPSSAE